MTRSYLKKPIREMEQYILSYVYPQIMDRTVISRRRLDEVISETEPPASWRALTSYDRNTSLVAALKTLGWEKYSKGATHRINAWVLPEAVTDEVS